MSSSNQLKYGLSSISINFIALNCKFFSLFFVNWFHCCFPEACCKVANENAIN